MYFWSSDTIRKRLQDYGFHRVLWGNEKTARKASQLMAPNFLGNHKLATSRYKYYHSSRYYRTWLQHVINDTFYTLIRISFQTTVQQWVISMENDFIKTLQRLHCDTISRQMKHINACRLLLHGQWHGRLQLSYIQTYTVPVLQWLE